MKSLFRNTLLCAVIAGSAVLPALRAADDDTATAAAAAESGATKLGELATKLNLTDEQKAKIAPILQKEVEDLKALQADTSLRKLQRLKKAREINNTASSQIRALLTAEQQAIYDEMRAEAQAKMKEKIKEKRKQ